MAGGVGFQQQLDLAMGEYGQLSGRQAEVMAALAGLLENSGGGARQYVGPTVEIDGRPHRTMLRAIPTVYGIPQEAGDPIHEKRGRLFVQEPPRIATEIDFGWNNLDDPNSRLQYREPEGVAGLNMRSKLTEAFPAFLKKAGVAAGDLVIATPYMENEVDNRRALAYMMYGMGPLDVNKMQMGRIGRGGGIEPELLNEAHPRFVEAVLSRRRRA